MNDQIPLLNFLKSTKFILYVAFFTVLFLAPNTYFVYYLFSRFVSPWREVAGVGVALIVAASVMIFTLRNNRNATLIFALFEILVSGFYYVEMIGWNWPLIPAIGFTFILPYSVYCYSKEISKTSEPERRPLHEYKTVEEMERWMDQNPEKRPSNFITKNH